MSRYAERTHLTQFSLPAAALGGISTTDQDATLDAASDVADSYLGVIFKLPLLTWGDDLRRAVCDLASWMLIKRRGFSPQNADGGMIREAYDDAISWLERVAAGKAKPSGVTDSETSGVNSTVSGAVDSPFVVAPNQNGRVYEDDFWRDSNGALSVGPSRRRGW